MKKLNELYDCDYDIEIKGIKINSKEVEKGDIFVCTMGVTADRHNYIDDAIEHGASCVVVSRDVGKKSVPVIKVEDTNEELSILSKKFFDYHDSLKLIGVTGTDGKTTTSLIIRDMLDDCGYMGSIGIRSKKESINTNNTTPDINIIYKYLSMFEQEKLKYASMEVSSEGLLRDRVRGLSFDIGILTNITEDHLNIHKTLSNYIDSKIKLFKNIKKDGYAILNHDSSYYDKFLDNCKCNTFSYGKNKNSDLVIDSILELVDKTEIVLIYKDNKYKIETSLKGEYNAYNLSAAISTLICLGFNIEDIVKRVDNIKQVEGRCEVFDIKNFKVVLDYAHTANGLKSILTYLNKVKKNKIITITGSAGGREKEKRQKMGETVQELSDLVIYTMDDPRYENVLDIIDDLKDDSKDNYIIIEDREEAIKKAFSIAKKDDIILVAGKGRDNYMAIEDKYVEYNDYDVIMKLNSK